MAKTGNVTLRVFYHKLKINKTPRRVERDSEEESESLFPPPFEQEATHLRFA